MKSLLRPVIIALVLLAVAVPGWIAIGSADLPTVEDDDLRAELMPLEPAQNLATHLDRLGRGLTWLEGRDAELDALRRSPNIDERRAIALLPKNSVLDELEPLLAMPRLQVGGDTGLAADDVAALKRWQSLAKVLALRSVLRAQAGRSEAAYRDALTVLRLGRRIEGAEGAGLVQMLLGAAVRVVGLQAVEAGLRHGRLDAARAFRLGNEVGSARSDPASWRRVFVVEYQRSHERLTSAFDEARERDRLWKEPETQLRRWVPDDYLFQRNRTLDRLAQLHRHRAADLGRRCEAGEPAGPFDPRDPLDRLLALVSPNGGGDLLLAVAAPDYTPLIHRLCAADARVAAIQVSIALKAYHDERRSLPEDLAELVPFYIPVLPADPFTGEALRYSRDARLLYSPGSDGIDRGGERAENEPEFIEPAYPLPI